MIIDEGVIPEIYEEANIEFQCSCGTSYKLSETVYELLRNGNIMIKCNVCKKDFLNE